MKKPRDIKTEVDLTKPVSNLKVTEGDCFGQEWNPQSKDCSICADNEICGIKYQEIIKTKKTSYEKKQSYPLDMTDFKNVNMDKIVNIIAKYQDDEPLEYEEVEELIMKAAKTKDKIAVREFIKRNTPTYNITIKDKKFYVENLPF